MNRDDSGVTLIELLVALAILVTIINLAAPIRRSDQRPASLQMLTGDIMSGLRLARSEALTGNKIAMVTFNLKSRTITFNAGRPPVTIPDGVNVSVKSARTTNTVNGIAQIVFFPDGSNSGGSIALTSRRETQRIEISWSTGRLQLKSE